MSISISPAIQTTPALDSLFPIYWEDLTEEQKADGVVIIATIPWGVIQQGDEFSVTVTPTADLSAGYPSGQIFGGKGEPLTFTVAASENSNLGFTVGVVDDMGAPLVAFAINVSVIPE